MVFLVKTRILLLTADWTYYIGTYAYSEIKSILSIKYHIFILWDVF